ncbi:hypothetical protein [Maribacter ulvicola]|uniref:Isocitrate lyase n=1 Tax=Maribacter ulvicola TaxID=228959 RepID=A0A1N6RTQ6_9FLAO|nr:hypothetical protein [Maribacter ulvicola]SIQ32198.1 isocitrate lyase [Maribacter ulvicola]
MLTERENMAEYDRDNLMDEAYDTSALAFRADLKIRSFQVDGARGAGIFQHLMISPTYYTTVLQMSDLT